MTAVARKYTLVKYCKIKTVFSEAIAYSVNEI